MATKENVEFLGVNVYEEAKRRIKYCYANWDHVWLSFSGGKDSLCVLWLMREVLDDMGLSHVKVNAFFRDEEVIPDDVISFVQGFIENPDLSSRFNVAYFAVPMASHIFMMGEHWPYVQWDKSREWLREPPEYAIRKLHPEDKPMDQHEMNGLTAEVLGLKGKIAILNGLRADESLNRYRSCVAKKGRYNWVMGSPGKGEKNIAFCKPIFDWATGDLFKYFKEKNITYPSIYDTQLYSGESLRVSTPLHDRAYQSLVKLRVTHPKFYEQILHIWPEVATHERYYCAVDRYGIIDRYPKSWEGIIQYIEDNIDSPTNKARAMEVLKNCKTMKDKNRRLGRYADKAFGFPLLHVFKQIVAGSYMKGISTEPFPPPSYMAYEEAAENLRDGGRD
jgi:predicted phosphoadenosine phosphosulfate sulfurtransferase